MRCLYRSMGHCLHQCGEMGHRFGPARSSVPGLPAICGRGVTKSGRSTSLRSLSVGKGFGGPAKPCLINSVRILSNVVGPVGSIPYIGRVLDNVLIELRTKCMMSPLT